MTPMRFFLLASGLLVLCGCEWTTPTEPNPDLAIQVAPSPDGMGYVAIPPDCPAWSDNPAVTFDNQPLPQFGCANTRNLAIMVDRPEDMLQGRDPGTTSGVTAAGATARYNNNQTRGLIDPSSNSSQTSVTTAPTPSSALTGDAPSSSGH